MKQKGFTLLELLLTIGVASTLMIGGISLYNVIKKNHKINETVNMINIISAEVRRLYANTNSYGNWDWDTSTGSNIELALYNNNGIPEKYKLATSNELISPYDSSTLAVSILGQAPSGWYRLPSFRIRMRLPQNIVPYIAMHFDPAKNPNVIAIRWCRAGEERFALDFEQVIEDCGSSDELIVNNFDIMLK